MVREFHETFGLPVRALPTIPLPDEEKLRVNLLQEEFKEYRTASYDHDIVDIADALADMVYVIYGTALTYGIDLDAVIAEVHRSNMSKLGPDGKPVYRADGKVIKGPHYLPPDVLGVLAPTTMYVGDER